MIADTSPPMVVLRPGDRVLVTLSEDPDDGLVKEIASGLRQSFPGVEFVVITGVSSICIQGGE